ncbi:Uncharacterised protein [Metamycoplasma cloacale]|uniref:Uncharacterized protein n=1 Tax=Metamycoplasma cloacale TaxID=92401 RepID=A0A2Z4LMA7_9BACT|nr:hypothetical protein [Metamycoplasma cloacale]AWX42941.1 hypothetical protein DK849_02630 [Metamycoplasma cloacale]VEU79235.1 Uncharacterised protein [Metamycoplasma cloacale]
MAEKKMKKDRKGLYIFLGTIGGTAALASLATGVAYAVQKNDRDTRNDAVLRAYSVTEEYAKDEAYRDAINLLTKDIEEWSKDKEANSEKITEAEKKIEIANNKIKENEKKYQPSIIWKVDQLSLKEVKEFNPTLEEVKAIVKEKEADDLKKEAEENKKKADEEKANKLKEAPKLNKELSEKRSAIKEDEYSKLSQDEKDVYASNELLTSALSSEEQDVEKKNELIITAYDKVVAAQEKIAKAIENKIRETIATLVE